MGVGVHSVRDLRVTEDLLDNLRVLPLLQHKRGEGVMRVPSSISSGELPNWHTGHAHSGPEQRAGQQIFAWLEVFSRRGDKDLVQDRTAKGAGSDLFGRHLDHLVE